MPQSLSLCHRTGSNRHLLAMSPDPIPRTVAMNNSIVTSQSTAVAGDRLAIGGITAPTSSTFKACPKGPAVSQSERSSAIGNMI